MTTDKLTLPQQFHWGSKAETLQLVKPLLAEAQVPDLYFFNMKKWSADPNVILNEIANVVGTGLLAVRSSAQIEDGGSDSMAGAFDSLLNVDGSDREQLTMSINQVVQSMTEDDLDQVLVQNMVGNVAVSGVIMTFDVFHGAPYYCIDYDDESGRTDTITGGNGTHKSLYLYRHTSDEMIRSRRVALFLKLARELEKITECSALDIEFIMNNAGQMFLVQVRRIAASRKWHPVTERRVKRQLNFVERFVRDRSKKKDDLLGDRTILAVMPDWNPAEIIGTTPRLLASSLYRYLITDSVWHESRSHMGYRVLPNTELMVLINNHPYIDVRNSFNSLLPASLDDGIGEKLINAWLERLDEHPEFHDKVEFEIVPTCIDFCFEHDFNERYNGVLSDKELRAFSDSLTELSRQCISGETLDQALADSDKLSTKDFPKVESGDPYAQLSRASYLLHECKKIGTFSFSIVARHAFIAESLLRSAVKRGALTEKRLNDFKRSIRSVAGNMVIEYGEACFDQNKQNDFLRKYGHLRPGTYEITSLRYDERDDLFSGGDLDSSAILTSPEFSLTGEERVAISELLNESKLDVISPEQLLDYASKAISGREHVKFIFTRILSDALDALVRWGEEHGLSRDDLSYIDWQDIVKSHSLPVMDDVDRHYLLLADDGRKAMTVAGTFKLAHIISDVRDIYVATVNRSTPNFVGIGAVESRIIFLDANTSTNINLKEHIVCIENADPGFDWIFTKGPKALITKFGGANSHMAVRCAEMSLPAAIGCGEQLFERLLSAGSVDLNCAQKIVRPLHAG
ncbi:MAG: hypothetical protein COA63_004965 [Methylophaga sp.]|nr:hypothetical protein [Methylophaga sp.]